jgi:serine/threonine protein kinase
MSDATTPYLKGPADEHSPPLPADQMPTLKDSANAARGVPFQARVFGDYELISEVARGGMGVVYRAKQAGLNRIVALKMILAGKLANADDVHRFRAEAEAAARLQHPNIVAVFEVGEIEGQHFFSMEFIDGASLSQMLHRGPIAGRRAARYLQILAQAVHYAHQQGIVHRDLKPSNILIDKADQPHITDFGLAKQLNSDNGKTRTGTVLGTPSYMAPEQAEGRTAAVGPAADIYSLGAVLYECITGRPPFRNDNVYDTVRQVINDAPRRPRDLNPKVDEDLELICLKCLEKDPALRYDSAEALADDLRRFLDGEPISARSLNVIDRITRMLDRSQHDFAFHTWSTMLFIMAGVIAVEHVLVFILMRFEARPEPIFAARFLQFVILVCLFLYNRGNRLWPTTAAERELWTIWIGYFVAYGLSILTTRNLARLGIVASGQDVPPHLRMYLMELLPYPFISLMSGLAFFVMGSNYWGRCYAFGVVFWMLAAAMPLHIEWAPLEFGFAWSVALVWLGWHLERMGKKVEAERAARP